MKGKFFLFLVLACNSVWAAAPLPTLRVDTPSQSKILSLEDLQKFTKPVTLKVYNPLYKREMIYQGFWLEDVARMAKLPKGPDIIFLCRDGYTTLLPAALLGKRQWLMAYGESSGGWTPMNHGPEQISPSPWYLVGAKAESFGDFPWPYQVVAIRSLKEW
jgi:hypothetical protein